MRDGEERRALEYVGFVDGRSEVEGDTVGQGQTMDFGVCGGRRDGVRVCRRPCSRPESIVPAAMVEPHRGSETKFTNHSNSYVEKRVFVVFLCDGRRQSWPIRRDRKRRQETEQGNARVGEPPPMAVAYSSTP